MYVMDGYSLKQSQNIIIQVKNKTTLNWNKKILLAKSWMKYILLPLLYLWVSCSALFTWVKAAQLFWYEFSTYFHQCQPPSVV